MAAVRGTPRRSSASAGLAVLGVLALAVAACGSDDSDDGAGEPDGGDATLTLYSAQHEGLAQTWVDAFTEETGIDVAMRSGKDSELANLLVEEGSSSPADVFITENSPAMGIVDGAGLFAPVDPATLAQVPEEYAAPDGSWLAIASRSAVFIYNPSQLPADELPASIMDLADPVWKDRVGIAAAGADFQAIVSAVLVTEGEDATRAWLEGLKENAEIYSNNIAIMQAVNAGEVPAGIIYHYYWYRDQAESGASSSNTELLYFTGKDPGGFLSLSGGGVLASSDHPAEAQQLLAFITGPTGQELLAKSTALEYPVGIGVAANPQLKPVAELDPPDVDPASLNGPETVQLMQDAGLL